ncbi:hypothetical protein IFM89_024834 [Coptis chinensis]|uniref:Uncharacterized protein n=1 Tax=Coptis chinensis TaxID=261450 RepID=A0A835HPP1_9MAGN|nr:hypothetical protein IFM89_024834 [Coptis chinensis]
MPNAEVRILKRIHTVLFCSDSLHMRKDYFVLFLRIGPDIFYTKEYVNVFNVAKNVDFPGSGLCTLKNHEVFDGPHMTEGAPHSMLWNMDDLFAFVVFKLLSLLLAVN